MTLKVDMDETLCYLLKDWADSYNQSVDDDFLDISKVTEWNLFQYTKHPNLLATLLGRKHLFENLKPIENACDILEDLLQYYDIVIVSDAGGNINIMEGKINWIKKHLPFIDIQRDVFFTKAKNKVEADIIIDDGPFILEAKERTKLLMDRAHNRGLEYQENNDLHRVYNWEQIYYFLLQEEF